MLRSDLGFDRDQALVEAAHLRRANYFFLDRVTSRELMEVYYVHLNPQPRRSQPDTRKQYRRTHANCPADLQFKSVLIKNIHGVRGHSGA